MKYLLPISLLVFGCQCETRLNIQSKSEPASVTSTESDAGIDEEARIQAILANFTPDEINQMFLDIPFSDKRPESVENLTLLSKALTRLREGEAPPAKATAVNEKLRRLK